MSIKLSGFSSLNNLKLKTVAAIVQQYIAFGGSFSNTDPGLKANRLVRLNNNGSVDSLLSTGSGFDSPVYAIAVQNDGKTIVGGDFYFYNGNIQPYITRLTSDGDIDPTFSIGNGFDSTVSVIRIQSDGKIIIGGSFTVYNDITQNYITRLNTDGTLDLTFNTGSGFNSSVNSMLIQPDGKIIVGGSFTSYNGNTHNNLIRLNADGSVDSSFNIGTGFDGVVLSLGIQSDNKIIAAGNFTTFNGSSQVRLVRLETNGSFDSSYNIGSGFDNLVNSISIQSDNKVVAVGIFNLYNGTTRTRILRIDTDGSVDTSYNVGSGLNNTVFTTAIQSDDKVIVGGFFTTYNGSSHPYLVRINTDGTADNTLDLGTGFNPLILSLFIQSNGKISVGGDFTDYKGTVENKLVLTSPTGKLSQTFSTGTGFDDTVYSLLFQPDGKLLVSGTFTSYDSTTQNCIARLNVNGSLDPSFNTGDGFDALAYTMALQPDGKILVGGAFTLFNAVTHNRIVRLETSGSEDSSFITGAGFNQSVNAIALQSDGKVVVGGAFTTYDEVTYNHILRLNADGTVDSSFVTGTGLDGTVLSIAIQADGKIVVVGSFTDYNGSTANRIVRLNTDGSIDSSLASGTGFDSATNSIGIQLDGKIIIGGGFTSYDGNSSNRIIRLNTDGTQDFSFSTGGGFNASTAALKIQTDGKIVVGGDFLSYNETQCSRIIRLNTDGTVDTSFTFAADATVRAIAF